MTPHEMRQAAALLDRAASIFEDQRCDDYSLPCTEEGLELASSVQRWNAGGVTRGNNQIWFQSWILMRYFAHRLAIAADEPTTLVDYGGDEAPSQPGPEPPMQPVVDVDGVIRFAANPIVRFLLNAGPYDMNTIAELPGVSDAEHAQFAQLIGYSLRGYAELSYVTDFKRAEAAASDIEEEETPEEVWTCDLRPGECWSRSGIGVDNTSQSRIRLTLRFSNGVSAPGTVVVEPKTSYDIPTKNGFVRVTNQSPSHVFVYRLLVS